MFRRSAWSVVGVTMTWVLISHARAAPIELVSDNEAMRSHNGRKPILTGGYDDHALDLNHVMLPNSDTPIETNEPAAPRIEMHVQSIPEPATLVLLMVGIGFGLAVHQRRRSHHV